MSDRQYTNLHSRLRAVWRREQRLWLAGGGLMFLRWGIMLFLAGMLMDWLTHMPAPGRVVILLVVLGVALFKAWRGGWNAIRRFNATRTALQIEERRGGMGSLLVSAIQLQDTAKRLGTSDALCELTCRKAEEVAGGIRPTEAVPFRTLRRPVFLALLVALVLGVLAVASGPMLLAGLGRIFTPWRAVAYPTRTQLALVEGDMVVQEGKPVRIAATLSGVVPKRAKLAIRTGKGRPRLRKLPVVEAKCAYVIETAFRGFEYRVLAGDARSEWHAVRVIASPRIERVAVKLAYPEYTRRAAETVEALTVTVPETTRIHWHLTLDTPVREALLTLSGQEAIPLNISEDGLAVSMEQEANESRSYHFTWVEKEQGFVFTSPSHYLQVAPDQPPRVELTSPGRNLYATLGRKLDLAFRGRDDHGVGMSVVAYRVGKLEEAKVPFTPSGPLDGSEQLIGWDYRQVLTNLVVGETLSVAVELTDLYPGEKGPHRARSEVRRMLFMSREDYLAEVEKQKNRLLKRLKTIYREERSVHETILRLDSADPVFVQTCQLEAVRQDLMRERLNKLAEQMQDLADDVAANSITNESVTATLVQLKSEIQTIAAAHVGEAALALRRLASAPEKRGRTGAPGQARAAHTVNGSARELGLLVLRLGFRDAADVMARELHSAAQTQASLRLRTVMPARGTQGLDKEQERLAQWLTRLFDASPRERESSVDEALIEFTLSRIVKQLTKDGLGAGMQEAAKHMREGHAAAASRIQSQSIAALVQASFRLRIGAEHEALTTAGELFVSQAAALGTLRTEVGALSPEAFKKRQKELAETQVSLQHKLQLLLMPAVPPPRRKLFDDLAPKAPPVADLLAAADAAMQQAAVQLKAGEREAAMASQLKAEQSFERLAAIAAKRFAALTQAIRIGRIAYASIDIDERLGRFAERQLSLLEKTEDAEADGTASDYLADQQAGLVDAVEELSAELQDMIRAAANPSENCLSLPVRMAGVVKSMQEALPLLKANQPGKATATQEAALTALAGAQDLLAEHGQNLAAYEGILTGTRAALAPSPYVAEIEEEQRDMMATTRATKKDDLPGLAIPQKNLVHAVDATLLALDPIAHQVESGTVMLFAKEDMDAAGEALEMKDPVEALDAQSFVAETLQNLRAQVDTVVPQYRYILELTESLHDTVPESVLIREAQRELRERIGTSEPGTPDKQEGGLIEKAAACAKRFNRITGLGYIEGAVGHMTLAKRKLEEGERDAAVEAMQQAEGALKADTAEMLTLMTNLGAVLGPPDPGSGVKPEVALLLEVLAMAAQQQETYRENYNAKPGETAGFEPKLRAFEKACEPFIERAKLHKNPVVDEGGRRPEPEEPPEPVPPANLHRDLAAAKAFLAEAAAGAKAADRDASLAAQARAAEKLRHFIVEYALKFAAPVGGSSSGDPVPTDDFHEGEDMMQLFMPGAVTGTRPPDGRLEWEVLGSRDRAALNENFARELPLEYRAVLKDYYERLAR